MFFYLNNFSQALTADILAADTSMTIDGRGDEITGAGLGKYYALTLIGEDGAFEIVYVKSGGTNTLTVDRGQEGTIAQDWPAGTKVENRLTAAAVNGFPWGVETTGTHRLGISIQTERTDPLQIASGYGSIAIGRRSMANEFDSVAVGPYATAEGSDSTAIGKDAHARDWDAVAVGRATECNGRWGVAVGRQSFVEAGVEMATVVGQYGGAYTGAHRSVCIGPYAFSSDEGSIAIGHYAGGNAAGQVNIGPNSDANAIVSGMDVAAIPIMRNSVRGVEDYQHQTSTQCSFQTLIRTIDFSAAVVEDKMPITLPAGAMMMVERIEVMTITSAATTYTPTVSIGTTVGGSDIVNGHVMSGSTPLRREDVLATPLADAISALYFKIDAASAGAMTIRFVVHAYVMEV